jgi:hypothetical protein
MAPKKAVFEVPAATPTQFEPITVPFPVAASMLGCTIRAVRELVWAKKLPKLQYCSLKEL